MQLRAAAYLYGIDTVPLPQARVLELGCGAGHNLFPFALAYPQAQVVGIDTNTDDIAEAEATAQKIGANNVDFHAIGPLDLGDEFGQFDYIVVHEAYSKLPREFGEALLAVCRRHLSPQGIAFVSYHTLPGWKSAEVLRDAMLFAGHGAEDIADNIAAARTTVTLLADSMAASNPMSSTLAPVLEYAKKLSDDELVAEFLHNAGNVCYFIEFANVAAQNGLLHVGDAEPEQEIALTFGSNVALFNSLTGFGQSAAVRQQHLDFAVGRHFRQSMLVHADRAEQGLSSPDLSRLDELRFAGWFKPSATGHRGAVAGRQYVNQSGRTMVTDDRGVQTVMMALAATWPASCDMGQLLQVFPEHVYESEETARKAVRRALEALCRAGMLRLSREATPYETDTRTALSVLPNLRALLGDASGEQSVATWSLWHTAVNLTLKPDEIDVLLRTGAASPEDVGDACAGWSGSERRGLMERMRCAGMLTGSIPAWLTYFRTQIADMSCDDPNWWQYLDAICLHSTRLASSTDKPMLEASSGAAASGAIRQAAAKASSLQSAQRYQEAEHVVRQLLDEYPNTAEGWRMLSAILQQVQRGTEAITAMGRAIALRPLDASLHAEFSDLLAHFTHLDRAQHAALRAIGLQPDVAAHHNNLARILRTSGQHQAALRCLEHSLKLDPGLASTYNILGTVSGEAGRPEEAEAYYRRALALNPAGDLIHSNLLFLLTHQGRLRPDELAREHRAFGENATSLARRLGVPRLSNRREPARRLRVGFVSGDLHNHSVMNFLAPIWRNLDRNRFSIHVYHTGTIEDHVTDSVRMLAQDWRRVRDLDVVELRDRIRSDGIDVLFDLSGHTGSNRLLAFAMRAAPVQVSWIGYPATTGLAEMDYYLIDHHVAPPGMLDDQFTEKLVYLPSAFTFDPHPASPAVEPLPALRNGYITFGSFNRYNKISDDVLETWAQILANVPNARILVGHMPDEAVPELKARFARNGVASERIVVRPRTTMPTYLAYHNEIDIGLDTFPYTGGTTSCHAVWMGVPVLTIGGATRIARQTAGVLGQAGLQEWVCSSREEFVEKATKWAGELDRLSALRAGMRNTLQASPMLRADYVTRGLEQAIQKMWSIWCDGKPATSFGIAP